MNKECQTSVFIIHKFPQISDAKLRAGIFNGIQIRSLMKDEQFKSVMSETEKNA